MCLTLEVWESRGIPAYSDYEIQEPRCSPGSKQIFPDAALSRCGDTRSCVCCLREGWSVRAGAGEALVRLAGCAWGRRTNWTVGLVSLQSACCINKVLGA